MKLGHDANDDMCEAMVSESLRFDASELISRVDASPFNATVIVPADTVSGLYEDAP
jgi:hypothetical protein